jgi:hypothetical protein
VYRAKRIFYLIARTLERRTKVKEPTISQALLTLRFVLFVYVRCESDQSKFESIFAAFNLFLKKNKSKKKDWCFFCI